MDSRPPTAVIKDLDGQIRRILRPIDMVKQSRVVRDTLEHLRQDLHDARIYSSGYELSETREEQLENAKQAKKYLDGANKSILLASQHDLFGPIDVAHLTALIDQVRADLK